MVSLSLELLACVPAGRHLPQVVLRLCQHLVAGSGANYFTNEHVMGEEVNRADDIVLMTSC